MLLTAAELPFVQIGCVWLDLTAILARMSASREHLLHGYLQAVIGLFYCFAIELMAGTVKHARATSLAVQY